MKYWQGKPGTPKQGMAGTMEDDGYVPDSIETTESEYNAVVIQPQPDVKTQYAALSNDSQRIAFIAQKLRLI